MGSQSDFPDTITVGVSSGTNSSLPRQAPQADFVDTVSTDERAAIQKISPTTTPPFQKTNASAKDHNITGYKEAVHYEAYAAAVEIELDANERIIKRTRQVAEAAGQTLSYDFDEGKKRAKAKTAAEDVLKGETLEAVRKKLSNQFEKTLPYSQGKSIDHDTVSWRALAVSSFAAFIKPKFPNYSRRLQDSNRARKYKRENKQMKAITDIVRKFDDFNFDHYPMAGQLGLNTFDSTTKRLAHFTQMKASLDTLKAEATKLYDREYNAWYNRTKRLAFFSGSTLASRRGNRKNIEILRAHILPELNEMNPNSLVSIVNKAITDLSALPQTREDSAPATATVSTSILEVLIAGAKYLNGFGGALAQRLSHNLGPLLSIIKTTKSPVTQKPKVITAKPGSKDYASWIQFLRRTTVVALGSFAYVMIGGAGPLTEKSPSAPEAAPTAIAVPAVTQKALDQKPASYVPTVNQNSNSPLNTILASGVLHNSKHLVDLESVMSSGKAPSKLQIEKLAQLVADGLCGEKPSVQNLKIAKAALDVEKKFSIAHTNHAWRELSRDQDYFSNAVRRDVHMSVAPPKHSLS